MRSSMRERIREIVIKKVENWFAGDSQDEKLLSDFVIFEEKISNTIVVLFVNCKIKKCFPRAAVN